jgi:hypothetical protein
MYGFDDNDANIDADFEALIGGMEVDEEIIEEREQLLARAQTLRAMADALEAQAEALDKSEEERDCHILPEHFSRSTDGFEFLAPAAERAKMRNMIPGMKAEALQAGMLMQNNAEEILEQMPDELREMFAAMPTPACITTVEATLSKDQLTGEEIRAWRTLFGGMLKRAEGALRMVHENDLDVPEEALAGTKKDAGELRALVAKLDSILV